MFASKQSNIIICQVLHLSPSRPESNRGFDALVDKYIRGSRPSSDVSPPLCLYYYSYFLFLITTTQPTTRLQTPNLRYYNAHQPIVMLLSNPPPGVPGCTPPQVCLMPSVLLKSNTYPALLRAYIFSHLELHGEGRFRCSLTA